MARAQCIQFQVPPAARDFAYDGVTLPVPPKPCKSEPELPHKVRPEHCVRELPAFALYALPVAYPVR